MVSDSAWAWWYVRLKQHVRLSTNMSTQVIRGNSVVMLEALERIGGDRDR